MMSSWARAVGSRRSDLFFFWLFGFMAARDQRDVPDIDNRLVWEVQDEVRASMNACWVGSWVVMERGQSVNN